MRKYYRLLLLFLSRNGLTLVSGAIVPLLIVKVLGIKNFGLYSTLSISIFIIQGLSDFGLNNAYMRDTNGEKSERRKTLDELVNIRLLSSMATTLLFFIPLVSIKILFGLNNVIFYSLIILLLALPIFNLNNLMISANIYDNNLSNQVISEVAGKIVWIGGCVTSIIFFKSIIFLFVTLFISILTQLLIINFNYNLSFKIKFKTSNTIIHLKEGAKFLIGNTLITLYGKINVILINALTGNVIGGGFALGYRGVDIMNDISMTTANSIFSKLKNPKVKTKILIIKTYLLILSIASATGVFFAQDISLYLAPEERWLGKAIALLAILASLTGLNILFYNFNLAVKSAKKIAISYICLSSSEILAAILFKNTLNGYIMSVIVLESILLIFNLGIKKRNFSLYIEIALLTALMAVIYNTESMLSYLLLLFTAVIFLLLEVLGYRKEKLNVL